MDIRDEILKAVEKEIIGPCPNPNYLDVVTGEEILLASIHGSPKTRYGAGILYPQQIVNNEIVDTEEDPSNIFLKDEEEKDNSEIEKNKRSGYNSGEENGDI